MKKLLFGLLLVPAGMVQALDTSHILTAEQWAVPRNVETIIQMPALASAMAELQATPGGRLLIRYPGGDAGTLWMTELHSCLQPTWKGYPVAQIPRSLNLKYYCQSPDREY